MLKAQLACKNIVKAVSAGPKAKWVECVLTDSTEWETVCKVLGEGTVVGVVDEKLVEGMAMALKMGGPEVTSAIEEAAVVVKGYVGPSWPAESVLKLLSACLSKPEAATRTPRCLDLAIHMSTIIGKNHQKTIFETCCKDRTSYLNPMLEQGLTSLLEAVLFPSPADWMAYFKPKIEEDEVKQLVTLLRSGDHSWKDMVQHSKTEGGEKTRGVKKASMSLVFETVAACLTPDYFHLLLKSFQTSVLSLPATVEGKEIVVLRFFAVLLKITTTVARSPAALTAAVRTLVIELRCYHTQTDILYQNGLGFALLEFLSRQTIDSLSDNTVKDKRERRKTEANGLEIATRLLDLYHKLVEGDMREYCRTAMKEETKAGKTFLKNSFEKYAEMQSLDTVMEAVMKEQSVLPTKCDWLLELISKTLPKLIDFTSVANLVFEDTPAEQLPIVEHIAKGLKVDDISAATAATWVDNAMAVLLSQQIGDGSSKVKNPAKFVKILNLYLALQSVLDRASPFFLSNDIFKWSARSIQAFRLTSGPSSSSDANDVPILLLPQQDIVLTLGQVVSMCCNGDILDENNIVLRRSVVGLLHQRAMRLMKHKEIMSCWEDLNPEDATVMDKQLKVVCTKLFELSNGCLGLSSSGIPTEDLPYLAQYTSKSALKTFVCLLLEAARPVDKSPKMKNPTIAPISQDSPWTVQLDPYTPPPFLQSEAVWESPVLSKALLSSASDAMCPRSEPWVVERAASWLRCAPVSLLGDKADMLESIYTTETTTGGVELKMKLRETIAHVGKANPNWCSEFVPTMREMVDELDPKSQLQHSTLSLATTVLKTASPVACTKGFTTGNTLLSKLVKGLAMLGAVQGALDISFHDMKRKSRKRKHGEEGLGAVLKAVDLVEPDSDCLLLAGASIVMLREAKRLTKEMAEQFWKPTLNKASAEGTSSSWLLGVALECFPPVLSSTAQQRFLTDTYTHIKRPVDSQKKAWKVGESDKTGLLTVLLSKIEGLPKTEREDTLQKLVKKAGKSLDVKGCDFLTTFLVTCPGMYHVAKKEMQEATMRCILEAHRLACLGSSDAATDDVLRGLCGVASACCLMEKFELDRAGFPVLITLPKMMLKGKGNFLRRFGVAVNIASNIILHCMEQVAGVWGLFVHSVADLVEAFLEWQEDEAEVQFAEEPTALLVRVIELLSGAKRRPDIAVPIRGVVTSHACVLLQRFLASVVAHPTPANLHNRDLARAFSAIMSLCGKNVFATTYTQIPQNCRVAASAFHLQWESTRFQGKT